MTAPELVPEPCPWCGVAPKLRNDKRVGCANGACPVSCVAPTIESWNTRARLAAVSELVEALEAFAKRFEEARENYAKRYEDHDLGRRNFDAMPDHWPMDRLIFSMGHFRRADRALANARLSQEGEKG